MVKKILLALFILCAIILGIIYRDYFEIERLNQWMNQLGGWAPIIFILIYIIASILFLPASILTLSAGVFFGPVWGVCYSLTGATLGAVFSFLIARYLLAEQVASYHKVKLQKVIKGIENEGWRFVAFVRLVPLFPFSFVNYAFGVTGIKLASYTLATAVFMLPGSIAYTYLGYAGREAVSGSANYIKTGLIVIALLAIITFVPKFIQHYKNQTTEAPK